MSELVRAALAAIVDGGTLSMDEAQAAMGAVMVTTGRGAPSRATRSISDRGIPSIAKRRRAASAISPPAPRKARYSACAAVHSGTRISTIGAPASTTSPIARP